MSDAPGFSQWWHKQECANAPGVIGADFRHWAFEAWKAALGELQPESELRARIMGAARQLCDELEQAEGRYRAMEQRAESAEVLYGEAQKAIAAYAGRLLEIDRNRNRPRR